MRPKLKRDWRGREYVVRFNLEKKQNPLNDIGWRILGLKPEPPRMAFFRFFSSLMNAANPKCVFNTFLPRTLLISRKAIWCVLVGLQWYTLTGMWEFLFSERVYGLGAMWRSCWRAIKLIYGLVRPYLHCRLGTKWVWMMLKTNHQWWT